MKLDQMHVLDSSMRWQNNLHWEVTEDSKEETMTRMHRSVTIVAHILPPVNIPHNSVRPCLPEEHYLSPGVVSQNILHSVHLKFGKTGVLLLSFLRPKSSN
jgi:hypothetical protein